MRASRTHLRCFAHDACALLIGRVDTFKAQENQEVCRRGATVASLAAVSSRIGSPCLSLPYSWILNPFWAKVRKLARPSTATMRRKELTIETSMPREIFEGIMKPVMVGEVKDLVRDLTTNLLVPTNLEDKTRRLDKFSYMIRRGGVSDRLFALRVGGGVS